MSEEKNTPLNQDEMMDVEEVENETEEAAAAVEAEVVDQPQSPKIDTSKGMNIWVAILLGIALIAILAVTLGKSGSFLMDPDEWGQGGRRSYIWVQVDNVYQADKGANFSLSAPEEINGYSEKQYWVIENYIYDIWYCDESGQAYTIVHKCKKDDLEEADENVYSQTNIVTVNGIEVTERGSNDMVQSLTWSKGGYYYQILTGDTALMEREYAESLVSKIN